MDLKCWFSVILGSMQLYDTCASVHMVFYCFTIASGPNSVDISTIIKTDPAYFEVKKIDWSTFQCRVTCGCNG